MPRRSRVLVTDDEAAILSSLRFALEDHFDIVTAADSAEALRAAEAHAFDVCLVDLRLGREDGMELVERLKEVLPDASLVIMTAYGTIRSAVECMRRGAHNYITKPLDIDEVRVVLEQAAQNSSLRSTVRRLDQELGARYGPGGMIGQSHAMQQVFSLIDRAKWVDSNVLILGESGTGKELVARALHFTGARKHGPFEAINCSAIPCSLLESELFGYERGAFTGASTRKIGRFEMADGGTLFLDEIGDMEMSVQAKILRALEDRIITPLGGTSAKKVDVRIVAASNKDLEEAVARESFREDLYYRLRVISITLPPLRERRQDIPLLVQHFVQAYSKRFGKPVGGVAQDAMWALQSADYRGNVRELENVVEAAVALKDVASGSVIEVSDLPDSVLRAGSMDSATGDAGLLLREGETLADLERRAILETLRRRGGRRNLTAKALGISERCLRNKLREYRKDSVQRE